MTVAPYPLHSAMPLVGKTDLAEQQREWRPLIPAGPRTSPVLNNISPHIRFQVILLSPVSGKVELANEKCIIYIFPIKNTEG